MSNNNNIIIDENRISRCGFPEIIYAAGKSSVDLVCATEKLLLNKINVLATRIKKEHWKSLNEKFPDAICDRVARTMTIMRFPVKKVSGSLLIISAGTSDSMVAKEAANSAKFFGVQTDIIADVGVAGIHRLLSRTDSLERASVIIVVAGMEGALPSVVGGLVSVPVIAVPTSVGYGASFNGLSALLGMLNSCASGLTVTNIDNGFGAACAAFRILNSVSKKD
ncbi:MAG: nickel pincer cofactor biosynthesis protein LarB [Verrucomicrobiota bacterium]|nr:nickel pincer cofactor biosynthesis protein LarB [Verrucomicrobiota bacterium]